MISRSYSVGASTLTLTFGDLTTSNAEVLVSSDDNYLTMGGGVSAALLRAGGEGILLDASKKIPATLGDVVVTSAGNLSAKHIFHAITLGDEELDARDILVRTTRRALELLDHLNLRSIAFPAIGAGVAGFAYDEVAACMSEVIVDYLRSNDAAREVTLYLSDRFGQMQPMDFLRFFEEFAVRVQSFLPEQIEILNTHRKTRLHAPTLRNTTEVQHVQHRKDIVIELGALELEREKLELQLAERQASALSTAKAKAVKRLAAIQERRVELLASMTTQAAGSESLSIFLSYSYVDELYRIELGKHLSVLERQGLVKVWHNRMITPGSESAGEITLRLDEADVVLLLISSDFVNSSSCLDIEMKRALERHAGGEALVVPIIVRPVSIHGTPFASLQALPKDAKASSTWMDKDSAYVDVIEGLRMAISNLAANRPVSAKPFGSLPLYAKESR